MGSSRLVDQSLPSVLLEPLKPIVEGSSRYFGGQSDGLYVFAFLELSDAPASKPQFVSRLLQQSLHDSFSRESELCNMSLYSACTITYSIDTNIRDSCPAHRNDQVSAHRQTFD